MKFEFSAGGIVYKKIESNPVSKLNAIRYTLYAVLLCQHSQHHGWVFPKGLIDKKETKEETAIREVEEETGIIGEIEQALTPITYWYVFDGEKIKKTVYYFIMKYIDGDINKHDFEMENVEWLPMEEVEKRLTYKSDKQVWEEAKRRIKK